MQERLQKYLSRCGLGSRRSCEKLIESGAVSIDGVPVTTLGTKVDPDTQKIDVDGLSIQVAPLVYFALHKPHGVVCTNHDPAGRPRAVDLIRSRAQHLYSVGRLDEESEGLLLITNDGEFAQRVAHPRYEVPKVYHVVVKGEPDPGAIEKIRRGVWLAEGKTHPARVEVIRKTRQTTALLITLKEGRNRHLRRVLAKVALPVKRLQRVRIGPVRLGTLKRGESRPLRPKEIQALRDGLMEVPGESTRRPARPSKGRPPAKQGGSRKPAPVKARSSAPKARSAPPKARSSAPKSRSAPPKARSGGPKARSGGRKSGPSRRAR